MPLQEEAVAGALAEAHALIVQAEALRLALVTAGARYRALFAWLLTVVRRMSDSEPEAKKNQFRTDASGLSEFIHAQLLHDAIGPQLQQVRGSPYSSEIEADAVFACKVALRLQCRCRPQHDQGGGRCVRSL